MSVYLNHESSATSCYPELAKMAIMIMLHRLNMVLSECVTPTVMTISIFGAATFKHRTANQYKVHSLSSEMPN